MPNTTTGYNLGISLDTRYGHVVLSRARKAAATPRTLTTDGRRRAARREGTDGLPMSNRSDVPVRHGEPPYAKVVEATMVPEEVTSFAPRSRAMSTWMFLENSPVPRCSSKAPTATVEPFATWSLQTIGPL